MNLVQKDQNRQAAESMFRQLAEQGRLSPDLSRAVLSGSIKYRDAVDYVKYNAAGAGGIVDLLKSTTDEAVGVSSFDKNRLAIQNARLVHKIFVGYDEADADIQAIVDTSAFKPALATADLIVQADGKEVYRAPMSIFRVLGSNVKPNERWYDLDTAFLLPDNKELKIRIEFADGTTLTPTTAGDKCAVSVHFGSVGTFV